LHSRRAAPFRENPAFHAPDREGRNRRACRQARHRRPGNGAPEIRRTRGFWGGLRNYAYYPPRRHMAKDVPERAASICSRSSGSGRRSVCAERRRVSAGVQEHKPGGNFKLGLGIGRYLAEHETQGECDFRGGRALSPIWRSNRVNRGCLPQAAFGLSLPSAATSALSPTLRMEGKGPRDKRAESALSWAIISRRMPSNRTGGIASARTGSLNDRNCRSRPT